METARSAAHGSKPGRPRPSSRGAAAAATASLAVLLLSAGCATLPADSPPSRIAIPAEWQRPAATGLGLAAPALDLSRWWDQLEDPTLSDLVARAQTANHDLRSGTARLRVARSRRALATRDYAPTVTAAVSRTAEKATGERADGATQHLYRAGFDASWEPDLFGATASAVRAAGADERAAAADLEALQVSLAAEVALDYVQLRTFQARLTIAQANLARQLESLELSSWRAQAGLTSELDVEQARTNVEQTRAGVPTLETGVTEAEHRLSILLGLPPGSLRAELTHSAAIPRVPARVLVGIPAETLRQRPDVRAAEQRLAAATARVDEAEAARYPSLRLSGSIGLEALSSSGLAAGETVVRSLLASLTAPIFDRARIERQIDLQSSAEEQALASYEQAVLVALREVEDAFAELAGAQQRRDALSNAAAAAGRAAELARDRYRGGLTSYQSVLDTERSLLSAEDGLTTTEAEATSALIRLYKALGGGWTPVDTAPAPNTLQRKGS
jgi:NodT family efflux transporter outer membrane factor (OMF) lipoprotein